MLSLGLMVVACGSLLTAVGADEGTQASVLVGIGCGGGLLNGETQKAIVSLVPRERAGLRPELVRRPGFQGYFWASLY